MILIALGSNLPSRFGGPKETLEAAKRTLERRGVTILESSQYYHTRPVPDNGQPWYINAVVQVATKHDPQHLMNLLHLIEAEFGRIRFIPNTSRIIDLDLISYEDQVAEMPQGLILPHPKMHERGFVLEPLCDIAPDWEHPVLKRTAQDLLADIPEEESVMPLRDVA